MSQTDCLPVFILIETEGLNTKNSPGNEYKALLF